jgi:hypothetical protein
MLDQLITSSGMQNKRLNQIIEPSPARSYLSPHRDSPTANPLGDRVPPKNENNPKSGAGPPGTLEPAPGTVFDREDATTQRGKPLQLRHNKADLPNIGNRVVLQAGGKGFTG